jgi:leucyl aminopeptidase
MIHLTYTPPDGVVKQRIGIVGKGLTFDSGGYNIKAGPGSKIELMKFDMGGSAATLGTAAAVAQLCPPGVEVHFVVATCENMISGSPGSLHPGDIITAMDGTTIEVNNTDAEGRLTLADALLYCQEQEVDEIVDVATLTGACMVALGTNITGMWSSSDSLATRLESSAKDAGEGLWRMPLEKSYLENLKSDLADMRNSAAGPGGAITAALFLQQFVRSGVQWAHLDIAGPAWTEKPVGVTAVPGATGAMVRTLTRLICNSSSASH